MPFNSSMASSQAPFFSSLIPINKKTRALSSHPNKFFTFKNSKISLSKSENEPEPQTPEEEDPIKIAFANAKSYKTNKLQSPLQQSFRGRIEGLTSNDKPKDAAVSKEVPLAVKLAMEKAKEYKKNKGVVDSEATSSNIFQNSVEESAEVDDKNEQLKSGEVIENGGGGKEVPLAVKLAMEKAKEYKKNKDVFDGEATSSKIFQNSVEESAEVDDKNEQLKSGEVIENGGGGKEVPLAVKLAMEKAKEYKKNKGVVDGEATSSKIFQNSVEESAEVDDKNEQLKSGEVIENGGGGKEVPLAVKLAMEKAKEYKKKKGVVDGEATSSKIFQNSVEESAEVDDKNEQLKSDEVIENVGGEKEVPLAVKIALEKAKEYKKNIGVADVSETSASGLTGGGRSLEEKKTIKDASKNKELTISSIDFVGLNFSDKKSGRGLPAGLVPISDPFPEGDWPEVEVLVGDASKFGDAAPSSNPIAPKEDDTELYKPKVTTWGLFPRPNDISKAYGGGRTLRPGEDLESAEERAAKQAKTRKLLAAYKTKMGLNIDPKLKSECEKALTEGDSLMDLGQLKEALPFYEEVMEKMVFQSELHGLAALQWSICQDSLNRSNEARVMYEKLQSHPSPKVSKKARQFVFGFQAMEMMKVRSSRRSPFTGYNKYFDAFVQDKGTLSWQDAEVDEAGLNQAIPYVIFLASPILMVLLLAASKPH